MSNNTDNQNTLSHKAKCEFLGINPESLFSHYDVMSDISFYNEFISSFPIPADYLSPESINNERDTEEAKRYGLDPSELDNEEYYMEDDERYINLNMDIDYEPDEYITEKCPSSDSESEDEWTQN